MAWSVAVTMQRWRSVWAIWISVSVTQDVNALPASTSWRFSQSMTSCLSCASEAISGPHGWPCWRWRLLAWEERLLLRCLDRLGELLVVFDGFHGLLLGRRQIVIGVGAQ